MVVDKDKFIWHFSYICSAMRVYRDLQELPEFHNAVITIGSFDGVHTGHQRILEKVNQLAKRNNGESIVITFHPHPRLIVYPKDQSLQLITTIDEKSSPVRAISGRQCGHCTLHRRSFHSKVRMNIFNDSW